MSQKHVVRILKSTLPVIMLVVGIARPLEPHENLLVPEPGEKGPCTVEELNIEFQGIETILFAPMEESCTSWIQSPFPGLIFAHGFSMMGLTMVSRMWRGMVHTWPVGGTGWRYQRCRMIPKPGSQICA